MSTLPITTIFFDVDDTLYPPQRGVWGEIARRINRYMIERAGIPEADVDDLRQRYFAEYGTTCNGLRREHGIDPQDYYRFVHDIPLGEYLSPDATLRKMLESMPQKKFIFSNADRAYILRVLAALELTGLFDGIIDIFATGLVCKPMDDAYRIALQSADSPPGASCLLVDDLTRNLAPARALGWRTVLVHHQAPGGAADHQITSIYELEKLLH
jgi:putative hydrolase of the HAD superfamily